MSQYTKDSPNSIRALFDSIASRYDLGNAVLSFNLHRLWNRHLVRFLLKMNPRACLDVCCGTGEIAWQMNKKAPHCEYHLLDFSLAMLEIANNRLAFPNVHLYQEDACQLPFDEARFCCCTIAYGIRNVENRQKCFSEIYRVLKPGGWLGIAELTRPKMRLMQAMHHFYLRTMVPLVGRLITSNEDAYQYLCNSIEAFVPPDTLVNELQNAGFKNVQAKAQTFGIATLFFAQK